MFCHAGPLPPPLRLRALCGGAAFRIMPCIRAPALRPAPPPVRGGRIGFGHRCLLRGKGRDGRSLFRAPLRGRAGGGRGRAYRGGAVRARDCPRETAGAPRPSVPAGVFFAAPAIAFCRNAERRPPGEPPLSTFILHHTGESQASSGTKNENSGDFSSTAGSGATVGGRAMRSQRRRCMNPAWLVSGSGMTGRGRRDGRFAMQRASIPGR